VSALPTKLIVVIDKPNKFILSRRRAKQKNSPKEEKNDRIQLSEAEA
jgi:hypothetical protein